jgi:DNA-binding transcriptional regulator GbsR (MarR family)
MKLEKIKREFVKYMEAVRAGDPYPRKFFGCLIAILIEPEPASQARTMKLTGYSQAAVSQTLQKIQLLMPLRTIKKRGERKHYYIYDGSLEQFILDLWQKRLEAQAIDIRHFESMSENVRERAGENPALTRFSDYLNNMMLYQTLVHELRTIGVDQFKQAIESGSLDSLSLRDAKALERGTLADFLVNLRLATIEPDINPPLKGDDRSEYLLVKNEYYSSIKVNLNPLYSQSVANQLLVIHDVFLEGRTTQEQIESSTLLPRSTISEILRQSVERGILAVTKKEGSRTKLYQPAISFVDLMLGNFNQLEKHIALAIPRLSDFISKTRKIRPKSKEAMKFLDVLKNLKKVYAFTQEFSRSMKAEMVIKLKEEHDRGFTFI